LLTRNKARALKCVRSRKCTPRRKRSMWKKKVMSLTGHLIMPEAGKRVETSKWWMLDVEQIPVMQKQRPRKRKMVVKRRSDDSGWRKPTNILNKIKSEI